MTKAYRLRSVSKGTCKIFEQYGAEQTANSADRIKGLAFRFATVAAVSTGKDDYVNFEQIGEFVAEGDAKQPLYLINSTKVF